ncbi:hypothetical protein [Maricaulis maris]|uniref:hypothetical protein n=1 Tax=Maricaulis maris TaxID=74318 RepID=UPI003B8D6365
MLSKIPSMVRGAIAGAVVVGVMALVALPLIYNKGRLDERIDQAAANYQAVVDRVTDEADRLARNNVETERILGADRAAKAEQNQAFIAEIQAAAQAADNARRAFDETRSCPAHADDVGVYNAAFGFTAAEPGSGDPGD